MRYFVLVTGIIASLTVPFSLAADESKFDPDSPEGIVEAGMKALKAGKWDEYADCVHPEALKEVRALVLTAANAEPKDESEKNVVAFFEGIRSFEELKKLDDKQLLAQFMKNAMRMPELKQLMAASEFQLLGHVRRVRTTPTS
jgi:hypothetical protein